MGREKQMHVNPLSNISKLLSEKLAKENIALEPPLAATTHDDWIILIESIDIHGKIACRLLGRIVEKSFFLWNNN